MRHDRTLLTDSIKAIPTRSFNRVLLNTPDHHPRITRSTWDWCFGKPCFTKFSVDGGRRALALPAVFRRSFGAVIDALGCLRVDALSIFDIIFKAVTVEAEHFSRWSAAVAWTYQRSPTFTDRSPAPRVLITGFHDWKELEGNVWRCRDNPSCRLLLGPPSPSPPIVREGPLVRRLAACCPDATIDYVTLPVTWGVASGLDLCAYDIIIHIGLGVYEGTATLLLEQGAYNERRGADAAAQPPPGHTIESGALQELRPLAMQDKYALLKDTELPGGFVLEMAAARPQNTFLCNETHYRALQAVRGPSLNAAGGLDSESRRQRPRSAYFLHIPYARRGVEDDYNELAEAVAALIARIVHLEVEQGRIGS
ncbi:hypothetical protein AB1Y20_013254 [Prymnesium parvum]|uniref:Pyroglutamyl-peptidase I n=1 Tax=Prymnesium parvum TaxID=97485 RepID=A0AB34ILM9_PRYPA